MPLGTRRVKAPPVPVVVLASLVPVRLQNPTGTPASFTAPDCTVPCTVVLEAARAAVAGTTEAAASSAPTPTAAILLQPRRAGSVLRRMSVAPRTGGAPPLRGEVM